nr:phosphoenolpyruvate carboxykinase (ATP) [Candidatus Nitrososphaera evergladensis]
MPNRDQQDVNAPESDFRIPSTDRTYMNLSVPCLLEHALRLKEGRFASNGAFCVETGRFTGRSPEDRYIVLDDVTRDTVNWNHINRPISPDKFEQIFFGMGSYMSHKDLFVFDGFVGANPENGRLGVRVITDRAWQCLFASQLFIKPSKEELESFKPDFLLLSMNDFKAMPLVDGTRSETFIVLNLSRHIVLIGSTSYAGEIKKAMFSAMNYFLPEEGVLPMHCAANVDNSGQVALFFGLSGTGKTTLSADPGRSLIGDDEHGWSETGVFNFEGGCYAKCINLKEENEPQIWNAIKFGSIMENVVIKDDTREPDYSDARLTENTRVAYPLDHIPGSVKPSIGGHPDVIIFLTADAFGVMPPISKLSIEGAMYHFLSGYTSKLAGTERGITEPKETFSECFGAPFMPRHPLVYARLLGEKIKKHGSRVYLVNTGWIGGPYGIGKRIELKYTRAMVTAALDGTLDSIQGQKDEIFNLDVPLSCPGVPPEVLDQKRMWKEKLEYEKQAKKLASMFIKNFEKFGDVAKRLSVAGPQIR